MEIEKLYSQVESARPEILAPAGGKKAFLAALAAGADAVYWAGLCGVVTRAN